MITKRSERYKTAQKRKREAKRQRRAELIVKDMAARDAVFERDGFKCVGPPRLGAERCGKPHPQWAHVFSRRYRTLRHLPENGLALCAGCHLAWHRSPAESGAWFSQTYPERFALLLEARRAI